MDIKDFILIGGGVLIVLVIAHGFWIAFRAKREPYRLDIVPDLIPENEDEMQRLRGELPNGGARFVRRVDKGLIPEQDSLDLEPQAETALQNTSEATPTLMDVASEHVRSSVTLDRDREPRILETLPQRSPVAEGPQPGGVGLAQMEDHPRRPSAEIQDDLSLAESGLESQFSATEREPVVSVRGRAASLAKSEEAAGARLGDVQLVTEKRSGRFAPMGKADVVKSEVRTTGEGVRRTDSRVEEDGAPALNQTVEELLIVNVIASKGHTFGGDNIVRALRSQGLRYGEMNIFHRREPMTKAKQFSVASMVEPGTFDLSDLETLASPGMSFFMQLPGPEDATDAFDDMMTTAQHVAFQLGGELRDEQMSVMTGQTREHMRQRIADFARRRLSIRA